MRKRSFRASYLIISVFFLLATAILFTKVLAPFQKFGLNAVGYSIFQYKTAIGDVTHGDGNNSSFIESRIIAKRSDEYRDVLLVYPPVGISSKMVLGEVLVGVAIEQSSFATKVELISSPFHTTQAVFGRSGIPVILEGRGAGLLETKLPGGSDIEIGDTAYIDDGDILIVGAVVKINSTGGDPLMSVFVQQPFNITTLKELRVHASR